MLTKPVRITTDLPPELHRDLTRWTAAAADELDLARLPVSDVIRATIKLLVTDKLLSEMVTALVRRDHEPETSK